jgi:hypothetical protein
MCRHISSRKGKCCEMASISRSIPFFCLEIPDAITNEAPLQKDDNLGLRGCITHNALFCLRCFLLLNTFNKRYPFHASLHHQPEWLPPWPLFAGIPFPKFAIKSPLKQLFSAITSLYGIVSLTLSIYDRRKRRESLCFWPLSPGPSLKLLPTFFFDMHL